MLHSTVTSKGQTTIPGPVRKALNIRPGARLAYHLHGNYVTVRVHPGLQSLAGSLASKKGVDMSFTEIRKAAALKAMKNRQAGR
jgi:AbrB family looped-hinge helix DNA binding protein